MASSESITRTSSLIAAIASLLIAISIPVGYFAISSPYIRGSMHAEVVLSARAIEEFVAKHPLTWQYAEENLQEMLRHRLDPGNPEARTIRDMKGRTIAEAREPVRGPVLTHAEPIRDSGRVVAYIEVKRSVFPLLMRTLSFGLFSVLLGIVIFFLFRSYPLRAVKKAYRELEANEGLLKSYLEYAPDGIYMADMKGNLLYGNRKAEEITGYKREELIGTNFFEAGLLSGQSLDRAVALHRSNREGQATEPDEYEVVGKDGHIVPIEVNTRVIEQGGRAVVLGFIRDITKRKQIEDALRESEEKYRILVEKANEAIFIGQEGRFVFVNPSLCDLVGIPASDLEGGLMDDIVWPEDREVVMANYRKRVSGEKVPDSYDFRLIGAGNNAVWVYLSATVVPWKGKPATLNMMTDITNLKHSEEERRHSAKLAAALEMAGSICHELNQPLQVISGTVDLLSMRNKDDRTRKALQAVHGQIDRLGAITKKLMGLKRYSNRDYAGSLKITDLDQKPEDETK